MERAELTEPFRALLDHGQALTYTDVTEAGAIPAQITGGETDGTAEDGDVSDRTQPASVFLTTFSDAEMITESVNTNTDRLVCRRSAV